MAKLKIPARLEHVKDARTFIAEILGDAGFPPSQITELSIVVSEAVSNAIDHGVHSTGGEDVTLTCDTSDEDIVITVEDKGGQVFDPEYFERVAAVRDWGKGGKGILIIVNIMDEVMYFSEEGQSTVLYARVKRKGA